MVNPRLRKNGPPLVLASSDAAGELDDAAVRALLISEDGAALAQLALWLKTHARTFAPTVSQAIQAGCGLSPQAAAAVLDAMTWRTPADADTTVRLTDACLATIAERLTTSVRTGNAEAISALDDSLARSAMGVLIGNGRSSQSEAAIRCLAEAGPGGALVLARAFDGVRSALKVYVVRQLKPADVLELGDNVVASLARSVSDLADTLESPKKTVATRFLAELGSVGHMQTAEIDVTEPLVAGDRVFHASWGAGIVVAANEESVTIDFGSAGTRTLLRALATLRHAGE